MKIEDPTVNELMMAQESSKDEAGFTLYQAFASFQGGIMWVIGIGISVILWIFFNTAFNIWLTVWTNDKNQINHTNDYYIGIYVTIGVMYGVAAFLRALIQAFSTPRMSHIIHQSMLSNLLFAPLNQFFDRVPLGRIINRFSKDLSSIDLNFSVFFANVMVFMGFLIGNSAVIVYCTSIWVLIPIVIYLIGVYILQGYYMKPNKELVRLQGITKSPVVSCFTEILAGVATIRAYGV